MHFKGLLGCKGKCRGVFRVLVLGITLSSSMAASARDQLKIVGSSTVHPFAKVVAKAFAQKTGDLEPLVGTGGSGAGFEIFCAGVGEAYADISTASRPMKKSEWDICQKNGVSDITEISFGKDGLTLVEANGTSLPMVLTRLQLYKAIAAKVPINGKLVDNPYLNWKDIDLNLPDRLISIYGATETHGSYDIIIKTILRETCSRYLSYFRSRREKMIAQKTFKSFVKKHCSDIRQDGAYIGADQNVEQAVKLINGNPGALSILGYSQFFSNRDRMQAVLINGVEPRVYTISDGSYLLSRKLYFYIKNAHRELVPGLPKYVEEFLSPEAMSSFGYLPHMGLGGLSLPELKDARYAASIGRRMRRHKN